MTGPFTLWVLLVLEFFIVTVLVFAGEAAARLNRVERLRQFGTRSQSHLCTFARVKVARNSERRAKIFLTLPPFGQQN